MNNLFPPGMILWLCFCVFSLQAQEKQEISFGKVTPADFILPSSPAIDSNTNAVILSDVGSTHFKGNHNGWFSYVFKRQTRIKILNKKGLGLATVKLLLQAKDEDQEKIDELSGSTYNLENGSVVEKKLTKADLFEEKLDKHKLEEKFTMPGVVDGSIIEYGYTIISDFYHLLPDWDFQSGEAPCLWSEYNVVIPDALRFVFVKKGFHHFLVDKQKSGVESYMVEMHGNDLSLMGDRSVLVSANTSIHRWVMRDIPRLTEEDYQTTPRNYSDRLEFQLAQTFNGQTTRDYMNSWAQATDDLLKSSDFGAQLDEDNDWLDAQLSKIKSGVKDSLEQARKIYYHFSRNYVCTSHYNKYLKTNLKDVFKRQSGNVGELNLLLIAMLRRCRIKADPVLLSTRDFGFNLAKYPILERLNYVICRMVVGGKVYYLDASQPGLAFGQIPENCYNGHARVISRQDSLSVYFESDSLREKENTIVFVSNSDGGGLEGHFQQLLGYPGSYKMREKVNAEGIPAFFRGLQAANGEDIILSNGGADSLDDPESPLLIHYDFECSMDKSADLIYFNPVMENAYKKNPFNAATRKYPVEMPYALDKIYVFSMEIPRGYTVEEIPKSARVSLNGSDGMFEYLIQRQDNQLYMRTHIKLDKTEFSPEDYNILRDFFAYIARKENESIVFKKKP